MGKFTKEKFATQPSYVQRAYLGDFLPNVVKTGNFAEYYETLTNFEFLAQKVEHSEFGVLALIADYDLVDEPQVADSPDHSPEKVKVLKLIQGTLGLSTHILAKDCKQLAGQLAGQLIGRLLSFSLPEIQALLAEAKQWQDYPWLQPLTPSLIPPGGRLLRTLAGHSASVTAVAVTTDGGRVISASDDRTLKVWDMASGKELFSLQGHSDGVSAVAVTPDGGRVISASSDRTLKVWDMASGKELFSLQGHSDGVTAVAVTPDGGR
ncbi:WD40 repeat domain-containing protein, partial [Iningainema tapete]